MNNVRRKQIYDLINKLKSLTQTLTYIYDDELMYMENIPDNLQGGRRYDESQECCDVLQNAIDNLNSALDELHYIR